MKQLLPIFGLAALLSVLATVLIVTGNRAEGQMMFVPVGGVLVWATTQSHARGEREKKRADDLETTNTNLRRELFEATRGSLKKPSSE